jgi:hypothetical protein
MINIDKFKHICLFIMCIILLYSLIPITQIMIESNCGEPQKYGMCGSAIFLILISLGIGILICIYAVANIIYVFKDSKLFK